MNGNVEAVDHRKIATKFELTVMKVEHEDYGVVSDYGILATDRISNESKEIRSISSERDVVERFIKICEEGQVSLTQLEDVFCLLYTSRCV